MMEPLENALATIDDLVDGHPRFSIEMPVAVRQALLETYVTYARHAADQIETLTVMIAGLTGLPEDSDEIREVIFNGEATTDLFAAVQLTHSIGDA